MGRTVMGRGWVLCVCLVTGCMLERTFAGGSTGESGDTQGSSTASPVTTETTPGDTTPRSHVGEPESGGRFLREHDLVGASSESTSSTGELDADLNVESFDDIEASIWTIATQSDGSLVVGGSEAGHPVVEKYEGCGL